MSNAIKFGTPKYDYSDVREFLFKDTAFINFMNGFAKFYSTAWNLDNGSGSNQITLFSKVAGKNFIPISIIVEYKNIITDTTGANLRIADDGLGTDVAIAFSDINMVANSVTELVDSNLMITPALDGKIVTGDLVAYTQGASFDDTDQLNIHVVGVLIPE